MLIRSFERGTDTGPRAGAALGGALLGAALLIAAVRAGSYDARPRTEGFAVVLWALTLGCALGLLPRQRPRATMIAAIVALVLLAAWTAISAAWSDSAERTYAEVARVLGFAGVVALICASAGPAAAVRLSAGLTVAAGSVCALALLTRLAPGWLPDWLSMPDDAVHRLHAPFGYWNALGCWAAMAAALCLAWSVHARRPWLRGAALAGVPVAVGTAYLTYSRAAAGGVVLGQCLVMALSAQRWTAAAHAVLAGVASAALVLAIRSRPEVADGIGTAGAGAVTVMLLSAICACVAGAVLAAGTPLDRIRTPPRATRALLGAALAALALAALIRGPALTSAAWDSFRGAGTYDAGEPAARLADLGGPRYPIWNVAFGAFSERPLGGIGAGTFEYRWTRARPSDLFVRDAHSIVIESLAELGAVGAILVVAAFAALLAGALGARSAVRSPHAVAITSGGAAAFLVFSAEASVDWMWESTAVTGAALCAVAIAAAVASEPRGRPRAPARVLATLLAAVALAVQLPLLVAVTKVHSSQVAFGRGNVRGAVEEATEAIQSEPWAASPLVQRAVVLEAAGLLGPAAADAAAATRREPENWRPWIILARIEAERGRVARALTAAERARELNPRSPLFKPTA